MNSRPPRIVALRHETQIGSGELKRCLIVIADPPVAVLDDVQSIAGSWWLRAGGHPVGKRFASWVVAKR